MRHARLSALLALTGYGVWGGSSWYPTYSTKGISQGLLAHG